MDNIRNGGNKDHLGSKLEFSILYGDDPIIARFREPRLTNPISRLKVMNLKTLIREELRQDISNSYEAENYKNAILDAMHYLSKLLREKTSIDSDGASLVHQALGGETPKLRINKLQTESELDEQKGLIQILQGLYTGIRNPRSHEQIADTKNTAAKSYNIFH